MSRAIKINAFWNVVGAVSLVLCAASLSACGRRRRDDYVSDETRRRIAQTIADEWDRRATRDEPTDDAPSTEAPAPVVDRPHAVVVPAKPVAPYAPANGGASPMEQARACLHDNHNNMAAGDQCVVQVLRGRATTEQELGLLAITYRTMKRRNDAVRTMREYIDRYPTASRVVSFSQYIADH